MVHVSDFGLATGAHWLNCEPSFCRQAADLVRVSDFGLPTGTHWLNRDSLLRAQAADLLRIFLLGLPGASADPTLSDFFVRRLRTWCLYLISGVLKTCNEQTATRQWAPGHACFCGQAADLERYSY